MDQEKNADYELMKSLMLFYTRHHIMQYANISGKGQERKNLSINFRRIMMGSIIKRLQILNTIIFRNWQIWKLNNYLFIF